MENTGQPIIKTVCFLTFCSLLFFFLFCLQTPSLLQAEGTPLDSYLEEAFKSSEEIKAIELDILSLQSEIGAREIELSPAIIRIPYGS